MLRDAGNLLIDSPRFTRNLVEPIEQLGGIADVLLTHRDDVADADRYAERFGARVWIHEADRTAAPYATDLLRGHQPATVAPGVVAVPVPGHTRGSVVYAVDDTWLFSGDSLAWSRERRRPHGVPRGLLVLLVGADGVARSPQRARALLMGAPGPRWPRAP